MMCGVQNLLNVEDIMKLVVALHSALPSFNNLFFSPVNCSDLLQFFEISIYSYIACSVS